MNHSYAIEARFCQILHSLKIYSVQSGSNVSQEQLRPLPHKAWVANVIKIVNLNHDEKF